MGLLSLTPTRRPSLLNLPLPSRDQMLGSLEEAMFTRSGGGYTPAGAPIPGAPAVPGAPGLLSAASPAPAPSGGLLAPAAPAPARRERVSGWRLLDRVLGGETISEGLDNERARLQAEADAPARAAMLARLGQIAQSMGPAAEAAFALNPEEFGKSLSSQFADVTLAEGSVRNRAGQNIAAAPVIDRFDDRFGVIDPMNPGSGARYTAPREMTQAEITDRFKAENPVLGEDAVWVGSDGQPRGFGVQRPEVVSTPAGGTTNVIGADGSVINTVQGNTRPLTAVDRRQLREDQDAVFAAESINTSLDQVMGQISDGALNLGPMTNFISQGRNAIGQSDANSRNFASFRASLEKMRNDSLRLNNGVQTEGDAQRAWNELLANLNDEGLVLQRLGEIKALNQRAIDFRRARMEDAGAGMPGEGGSQNALPTSGPIAEDANGNRVQWNGSEWAPL